MQNLERYELRPATDSDRAFMQHVKLTGLRSHVEELWGWDEQTQQDLFRRGCDPGRSQIITVDGADAGYIVLYDEEDALFLAGIYLAQAQRHGAW